MKYLMTAVLGLSLLVPAMTFAQDTGGDKTKTATTGSKSKSKSKSKVKKTKDTTTPPAK